MRKDRSYPDLAEVLAQENAKLKKRAQKAEGELSILKGIETNRVKEAQAKSNQLQDELDKSKKNNNELYNRIAELIEANEKEVKNLKWIKDHDYVFLIDENKKLHKEVKELKEDNKKLAHQIEDRINNMRKSGM
jgi:cell division septum initiation protein DivIVA